MRHLKVNWILSELTLGQVWDVNLLKNEPVVKDIILVAQGEMALEEFLKQVRESWQHYQLDLVSSTAFFLFENLAPRPPVPVQKKKKIDKLDFSADKLSKQMQNYSRMG